MIRFELRTFPTIVLCALILLITLFFGLKPKGYRFINQVERCVDHRGIRFTNIGMLYGEKTLGSLGITDSLCITISIKPDRTGRRLSRILSIVGNDGRELLTIDQWKTYLTVSVWGSSGTLLGRAGIDAGLSPDSFRLISAGLSGKALWVTSDFPKSGMVRRELHLPGGFFEQGRIIAGFSANGQLPWRGELSLLMLTGETADPGRYTGMVQADTITAATKNTHPALLPRTAIFLFDDLRKGIVSDYPGNRWNLLIPLFPRFFQYDVLTVGHVHTIPDRDTVMDIIINLLGFIPLGAGFFLLFVQMTNRCRTAMALTLGSAFAVSLGIETAQVFIPTRTSQLFDVVFNVAGAAIGAFAGKMYRFQKPDSPAGTAAPSVPARR